MFDAVIEFPKFKLGVRTRGEHVVEIRYLPASALSVKAKNAVAEEAARQFSGIGGVGAWIHETHHSAKKDAPSGTALLLKGAMEMAGYPRAIDVASTRAGSFPGTHEVGFDAPTESVRLVHEVRDRAVFAHGALEAAKWLKGRRGWFSMKDMVG